MKTNRIHNAAAAVLSGALLFLVVSGHAAENPSPANAEPAPGGSSLAVPLANPQALVVPAGQTERAPDVVYVPTPHAVVDKMLELAEVKKGDVVYDLGCGDGRIVIAAAKKYGVKTVGFDIDPVRIKEARANVLSNRIENLVTIKQADIFTVDLREASVVTLYLLPDLNVKLMPQLEKLKPGSRIVSHDFDMRGAKPAQVLQMSVSNNNSQPDDDDQENNGYAERDHTIYKWIVPWMKDPPDS